MEAKNNEEAGEIIFEMYCRKYDIDPVVKTKGYDKVDRHKVDDKLYDDRIKDDDPLFTGE